MKYYVDKDGNYLGGWDKTPPKDAIEVFAPPADARQKWDDGKFLPLVKGVQEQIDDLENSVTKRNEREYSKGIKEPNNERFFYSTEKIDGIDAEIMLLRAQL